MISISMEMYNRRANKYKTSQEKDVEASYIGRIEWA